MLKSDAISLHAKECNWEKFPVFAWNEGGELVTEVDGKVFRSKNVFLLDNLLDGGGIPRPRNIYFVDAPDYETVTPNAPAKRAAEGCSGLGAELDAKG